LIAAATIPCGSLSPFTAPEGVLMSFLKQYSDHWRIVRSSTSAFGLVMTLTCSWSSFASFDPVAGRSSSELERLGNFDVVAWLAIDRSLYDDPAAPRADAGRWSAMARGGPLAASASAVRLTRRRLAII
jgi:hypothetical protein